VKTHTFKKQQLIRRPVKEVFDFFSQPENLGKITPDSLDFNILTPLPIKMKAGALIDYTIKPFLFPMRWMTMITEYDPPFMFIDQQIKGPYSFWHHTHKFENTSEGTLIIDEVVYALPFGIIGEIANWLFVRRQLNKIFEFRFAAIKTIFDEYES